MENILIYITIISVFLFNIYSQKVKLTTAVKKMEGIQIKSNKQTTVITNPARAVKSYQVVEKINMKFGAKTTTNDVSNQSLINKNNLRTNNTRLVIPRIEKREQLLDYQIKNNVDTLKPNLNTNDSIATEVSFETEILNEVEILNKHNGIVYIDILDTFERITEKGYKSVEMFKRLGNAYFFKGELNKAVKFYRELFDLTVDLEPEYYYHYTQSLRFIHQSDKANEMLEKFNQKSENYKITTIRFF